jgi:hypothetical protein
VLKNKEIQDKPVEIKKVSENVPSSKIDTIT